MRFAPVWLSTGRTARLSVVWWLYGAVAILLREASTFLAYVLVSAPAVSVAGALILLDLIAARLACVFIASS